MVKIESFDIEITQLQSTRTVWVGLPNGYPKMGKRYPVIYLQDGQDLFYDKLAYDNAPLRIDRIMEELDQAYGFQAIVIGVESSRKRSDEYSPWQTTAKFVRESEGDVGGKGAEYAEFFANDLKNCVDKKYHTDASANATAVAGKSLGAFISVYIGLKYPDKFGHVGSFSIPCGFAPTQFYGFVNKVPLNSAVAVDVYCGAKEGNGNKELDKDYVESSLQLYKKLHDKKIKSELHFISEGTHTAEYWSRYYYLFALSFLKTYYGVK